VVIDVDVFVVGPAQTADSAEKRRRTLAEGGLELLLRHQLVVEVADEPGARIRRWFVQLQTTDMHGVLTRFTQQKNSVGGHHQFHQSIRPISGDFGEDSPDRMLGFTRRPAPHASLAVASRTARHRPTEQRPRHGKTRNPHG
jgi:hypothetical protein